LRTRTLIGSYTWFGASGAALTPASLITLMEASLHTGGRLAEGFQGLDAGVPVRARLTRVDVEQGFIDLKVVPSN